MIPPALELLEWLASTTGELAVMGELRVFQLDDEGMHHAGL